MQGSKTVNRKDTEEEILVHDEEVQQLTQCLPKVTVVRKYQLVKYQGFWCPNVSNYFKSILAFQRHFRAHDTDLIVASFPKTGTTWLKSLLFSIANRSRYPLDQSPLLTKHPHELVYRLEIDIYGDAFDYPRPHHLEELPSPRLLHTHLPYISLPDSIKDSKCRILYINRNPLDTIVSLWHFTISFLKKFEGEDSHPPSIEQFFEDFYEGNVAHGPFFDHIVEYWKRSLEQPEKVLFLKYEDLKSDPTVHIKRMAEFVGLPFCPQEENEGVIQKIIQLCSINSMKEMEGNKTGVFNQFFEKKSYFRKGEVGDWRHHFTPSMVERMDKLMQQKFEGTGLSFKLAT